MHSSVVKTKNYGNHTQYESNNHLQGCSLSQKTIPYSPTWTNCSSANKLHISFNEWVVVYFDTYVTKIWKITFHPEFHPHTDICKMKIKDHHFSYVARPGFVYNLVEHFHSVSPNTLSQKEKLNFTHAFSIKQDKWCLTKKKWSFKWTHGVNTAMTSKAFYNIEEIL